MKNRIVKIHFCQRVCAYLLLFAATYANAEVTMTDLVREGKVSVATSISTDDHVAIGQQVMLYVDIASDTWFTKGTVVAPFDVENAIVQLGRANTVNSTARVKGQTYATQRWEIPLFPMKSGRINVPSLSISVQVKQDSEDVAGRLTTRPLSFVSALASPDMTSNVHWIVAESAKLDEKINSVTDGDSESVLFVGDSIERVLMVTASGTSSMMIPTLIDTETTEQVENYVSRVYFSEPKRIDKMNRGETTASFEQSQTFVLQGPGSLLIPEVSLLWWDPEKNAQTWLTLPSQQWTVKHTLASYLSANWPYIAAVLIAILATIVVIVQLVRKIRVLHRTGRLPLWVQFQQALLKNNTAQAESVSYKQLLRKHGKIQFVEHTYQAQWENDALKVQQRYSKDNELNTAKKTTQAYRLRRLWRSISRR